MTIELFVCCSCFSCYSLLVINKKEKEIFDIFFTRSVEAEEGEKTTPEFDFLSR